jgi:hypothetical protein
MFVKKQHFSEPIPHIREYLFVKNEDSRVGDFQGKINFFDLLSAEKLIFRGCP